MPLPLFLGIAAAVAAAGGVGSGVYGGVKMSEANSTMKDAESCNKKNLEKFEKISISTTDAMDKLGTLELKILSDFESFSDTIEKIQGRPEFEECSREEVKIPKYDKEQLKEVSVGAGVLLGGLGGAAAGTAGGFAAAGATTSAVMALGTASTGTAISSLSGVAATNATLAALGGGSLATGGGGMALGTTILGATAFGAALLAAGAIFGVTGKKMADKADEAHRQVEEAEKTINTICRYLEELKAVSDEYFVSLTRVRTRYQECFRQVSYTVNTLHKVKWYEFDEQEKLATQNAILLVGLLFKMCNVKLENKAEDKDKINTINYAGINESMQSEKYVLKNVCENKLWALSKEILNILDYSLADIVWGN